MNLLFLSHQNLSDRLFIREFVHHFKLKDKSIVIHDQFGTTEKDTRFVTKRISALLSEAMVYNNAFNSDKRRYFKLEGDSVGYSHELIVPLLAPIQAVLFGPVVKHENELIQIDPIKMLTAVRNTIHIEETIIFTDNPLSPLANKKLIVDAQTDLRPLENVYEEEKRVLALAKRLAPVRIASPTNFAE